MKFLVNNYNVEKIESDDQYVVYIDEDSILEKFSDYEISDEAEDRGLIPEEVYISDFSDNEIKRVVEERNLDFRKSLIEDLLLDYYTLSSDQFQKSLKRFFFKSIDEYIR